MSFGSYSSTPASNISCNGINIGENCPAANVNNVVRQLMADGKELSDTVAAINVSSYMPITGGFFTNDISRATAGAYLFHANVAMQSGVIYTQPISSALPFPSEGAVVFQY